MALPSVKTANPTRMTTTIPMGMMKRFISPPGDPTGHTATIGSSSRSALAVAVRPRPPLVEIALFGASVHDVPSTTAFRRLHSLNIFAINFRSAFPRQGCEKDASSLFVQPISRSIYAAYFAMIHTIYGAGDGPRSMSSTGAGVCRPENMI